MRQLGDSSSSSTRDIVRVKSQHREIATFVSIAATPSWRQRQSVVRSRLRPGDGRGSARCWSHTHNTPTQSGDDDGRRVHQNTRTKPFAVETQFLTADGGGRNTDDHEKPPSITTTATTTMMMTTTTTAAAAAATKMTTAAAAAAAANNAPAGEVQDGGAAPWPDREPRRERGEARRAARRDVVEVHEAPWRTTWHTITPAVQWATS